MLQTPAFVDTLGDVLLAQPGEVGRMVHAHFYAGGAELCD
jgi:hypothetical protein